MKRLIASITAYHISNNNFDKFDINKSLDNNGVGRLGMEQDYISLTIKKKRYHMANS